MIITREIRVTSTGLEIKRSLQIKQQGLLKVTGPTTMEFNR